MTIINGGREHSLSQLSFLSRLRSSVGSGALSNTSVGERRLFHSVKRISVSGERQASELELSNEDRDTRALPLV